MKRWIDFTDRLGSDGTIAVDGRLSINNIHKKAEEYAQRMRFILPGEKRTYQIIHGTNLLKAVPFTRIYTITVDRSKD